MGGCVLERDYLDYVEGRLGILRTLQLTGHALVCGHCRRDMLAWPALRRIVRRMEHVGAGRRAGLAEDVMSRIRCVH